MKLIPTIVMGVVVLHGCAGLQPAAPPEHTIFVLDSTASIVPGSFDEAVKAIAAHVVQMQRGDCITVLPIMSDSDAIPSDEIVRGCAPTDRQPYDQDFKAFRDRMRRALDEQSRCLSARKAAQTDLLGTLNLVNQEFEMDQPKVRRQVVIFSDFVEEDTKRNFMQMREVADVPESERMARVIGSETEGSPTQRSPLSGVPVYLGGLESSELPRLDEQRRAAIRHFWVTYFELQKAKPTYVNDGPGMSAKFLTLAN